jgi:PAS domain S-box-containing protein
MASAKVLIVDDDTGLASAMKILIENQGYTVVGLAYTSNQAVSLAVEMRPDVILMDIRLGGDVDGVEAVKQIQAQLDIPIIYVTGTARKDTLQRSKETGPFGYLFKPFEEKHLYTTIEMTLYRYKIEQKIRESEQWLNTILNSIEDGVIAVDCQGSITNMNPVAAAVTGWDYSQAVGKPLGEVFTIVEEASRRPVDLLRYLVQKEAIDLAKDSQFLLMARGGDPILIEATPAPILDQRGRIQGLAVAFRDITERRRVEEEIHSQASRSEALVRVASRLNAQLDLDRVLALVCEEAAQTLDAPVTCVILYDKERDVFDIAAMFSRGPAFGQNRSLFKPIPRKLYNEFLVRGNEPVSAVPDLQALGAFPNADLFAKEGFRSMAIAVMYQDEEIIGTLNAITVGRVRHFTPDEQFFLKGLADQAVIAIMNARLFQQVSFGRERMKMLSKKLVEVQENERRYLARELHDQVGQMLTGLQLSLEADKHLSGEELVTSLKESQSLVLTLMGQIRELSLRLRPTMLDDLGLLPTLLWYFDKYGSQMGISVDFHHSGMDCRLSPELETAVYRIIQEALTNVARYSKADQLKVECILQGGFLKILIQDNGSGFNLAQVLKERKTFGLVGMRERANLLGGRLEIASSPGKGTQVLAIFPLDRPVERRHHERNRPAGR